MPGRAGVGFNTKVVYCRVEHTSIKSVTLVMKRTIISKRTRVYGDMENKANAAMNDRNQRNTDLAKIAWNTPGIY